MYQNELNKRNSDSDSVYFQESRTFQVQKKKNSPIKHKLIKIVMTFGTRYFPMSNSSCS